ncbi:Aste57867_12269 [Aphanomyces stellatus]|uniref:Aste57867_12269 protein n=1 Tax=Aphanomyces stellatus TaxID=120398 RepID=A0A485KX48_9STRA|nr:hypothetical protein As57867_012224 [Aphanomyces stellatus]VFT89122.1 Aste57867_12269 [Aphanomyces stellatus]
MQHPTACAECAKRFTWLRWAYQCSVCCCTMCKACSLTCTQTKPTKLRLLHRPSTKICLSCSSSHHTTTNTLHTFNQTLDMDSKRGPTGLDAFDSLLQQTVDAVDAPVGSIQLIGDHEWLYLSTTGFAAPPPLPRQDSPAFVTWLKSTQFVVRDATKEPRFHAYFGTNAILMYVSTPLYLPHSKRCIGTLDVGYWATPTGLPKTKLDKLTNFATDVGLLVERHLHIHGQSPNNPYACMRELVASSQPRCRRHSVKTTEVKDDSVHRRLQRLSEHLFK